MARLPKSPSEAVEMLGVSAGQTVLAVGPDHGYVEAFAETVGSDGKVLVQSPPPDLETPPGVDVTESVPDDTKADVVIAWLATVPVHAARDLGSHVNDGGALWLVLPKAERDERAAVTEGEVKRAMMSAGWREGQVVGLATDAFAVRFQRRR